MYASLCGLTIAGRAGKGQDWGSERQFMMQLAQAGLIYLLHEGLDTVDLGDLIYRFYCNK